MPEWQLLSARAKRRLTGAQASRMHFNEARNLREASATLALQSGAFTLCRRTATGWQENQSRKAATDYELSTVWAN